jgi:uncharacterized delta-60 repeat protein
LVESFSGGAAGANSVAVQPNGRIVVAGFETIATTARRAVLRYLPDGARDPSFGGDGSVSLGSGRAECVVVLPDSRILVGSATSFLVNRLQPDGSLDLSLNGTGSAGFGIGPEWSSRVNVIARLEDGGFLAAGPASRGEPSPGSGYAIVRFLPDGRVDSTFGNGFGNGGYVWLDRVQDGSMTTLPDGRILAGGRYHRPIYPNSSETYRLITRHYADGRPDSSFGTNGRWTAPADYVDGLALLPDGRFMSLGGTSGIRLTRHLENGAPDVTFGASGSAAVVFFGGADRGAGLAVLSDDRVVVAGTAQTGGSGDIALARVLGNPGVSSEPETEDPRAPALRIWPNPARHRVTISFSQPAVDRTRLVVFDALGRLIAVLFDSVQLPGQHEVVLDGGSLAPGVYVLRLETSAGTTAGRLVITR